MDSSKKSIKITEIVRLQLIIKKWKKMAVSPKTPSPLPTAGKSNKTINSFLKRTLSFPDDSAVVPKGYLAVCVGTELRRFIIPTSYLRHRAFAALLHEAEEEFGFHQEGVLKIPCEVVVFERILKTVEGKKSEQQALIFDGDGSYSLKDRRCSSDSMASSRDHFQMCR